MMRLTTIAAVIALATSPALMAAGDRSANQNPAVGAATAPGSAAPRADSPASTHPSSPATATQSYGAASAQGHNETLVRSAQQALKQQGFDAGAPDGQMGPSTQGALREFQQSKGLPATGELDSRTLSALGVAEQGAPMTPRSSQGQGSVGQGTTSGPSTTSGQSTTSGPSTMPSK